MTGNDNTPLDLAGVLQAAHEDQAAVVKLTRELVRIPSRGGIDPYDPVLECMASWLTEHGLLCRRLTGQGGGTVALICEIAGSGPGPRYVLDACLDTAPFGDEKVWSYPPVSGEITEGWMHGRGSSDSKAGAAVFAHLAVRLQQTSDRWPGSVVLLFDVDEHTGAFGGAKAFFEDPARGRVDGVMIGYPGLDHVVTGGRGVFRARVHVHGVAGHSGASRTSPSAIAKAAALVSRLHQAPLPGPAGPGFPLPAKLTVTAIGGGEGYSTVPDLCTFNVDIRLTPALDDQAALNLLRSAVTALDVEWPGTQPSHVELTTRWPAFALAEQDPLRVALLAAAEEVGVPLAAKVAGPSNIGNYLAGLGIPATAGFGVDYRGLHGTDERIRLDSIPQVHAVYHRALLNLLTTS
ncbi:succinyl-diaminopimelate desuccinylase [Sinosporangium album]|uniref:Succinyl-diaminopimelate desuccinylase n=1 Tax=Sinosporangium album TaxID=504805 RepID=A0A1G7U2H0_9ACTN|nr:M20/M25/M40 family metallo-hydrolase [Sinosporangium album]SDG41584.1 succinyl-diaminopimelate desuccinylase [Sinosporangium album]